MKYTTINIFRNHCFMPHLNIWKLIKNTEQNVEDSLAHFFTDDLIFQYREVICTSGSLRHEACRVLYLSWNGEKFTPVRILKERYESGYEVCWLTAVWNYCSRISSEMLLWLLELIEIFSRIVFIPNALLFRIKDDV